MIRRAVTTLVFFLAVGSASIGTAKCAPNTPGTERRILAMAPHLVETLFAVGAGDRVVGVSRYANFPPEAAVLPRVGGYKSILVEAALRLKPELVFALNGDVEGVASLERVGVPVVVSHPKSIRAVLREIERIAERVCAADRGRSLAAELRARMVRIEEKRPAVAPSVFYEVWHDPLTTVGGESFIDDAIDEAGGRNVFAAQSVETLRVSVEAVLRLRPAVIVLSGTPKHVAARRVYWRAWLKETGTRIVSVDDDLIQRPGPRIVEGVAQLQQAIGGGSIR